MSKQKPYRFFLYVLLEMGQRLFLLLPRPVALGLAGSLGLVAYGLLQRARSNTLHHLRHAFGHQKSEREIRRIARGVFRNLAKTAAEVCRFPKLNLKRIQRLVSLEGGREQLDRVLARGHGVIALTGHIGNWELLASYFRFLGYEGCLVGRRIYYEPFNQVLVRLRASALVSTLYHDDPLKAILARLRANHVIGMSADQDIDRVEGLFVPFFGRPAWTPVAVAKIALASGAAILPMFLIHQRGRYRLFIEDPIWPFGLDSKEEAIRAMTEAWSGVVERFIRRFPDQWVWMHRRWRTTPERVHAFRRESVLTA